jgi:hypothetical protein
MHTIHFSWSKGVLNIKKCWLKLWSERSSTSLKLYLNLQPYYENLRVLLFENVIFNPHPRFGTTSPLVEVTCKFCIVYNYIIKFNRSLGFLS